MSAQYPGVRFSIRSEGGLWRWRAILDGATVSEGEAPTRAVAAAKVIQVICRVYGPQAAAVVIAKAA